MENQRFLTPSTALLVSLVHLGLIALMWTVSPKQPALVQDIQFVDLADLGMPGNQSGGEEAPAPTPEPPKPIVKPEPPKLKPVITQNKKADMPSPKEKVEEKPKPVEKPPTPAPKPVETPKPATHTSADGKGSGEGKGSQEGKGKGDGKGDGEGTGSGKGGGVGDGQGGSPSNPVRATGVIPRPPYPPASEEEGEEGTVILNVLVAPGGRVERVTVAKSSRYPRLDRAARNAAQNGHFKATVWTEFRVPVVFKLD